ncbi:MAG: exo-alpha-sialidase [Clostridiales bacterium]|nr:exo-alpha-sialidase [Clostridiales bacterium]
MKKLVTLALVLAMVLSLALPAFAAPEYGEHSTVATVEYGEKYWGQGISYTRIMELQHSGDMNGTLIATHEMYTSGLHPEKPGYNIHMSRDGGSTWEHIATVREKNNTVQSEYQPHIYELPCQLGDMPAGTLLLAACTVDAAHWRISALRVYRSFDHGYTWEQYSNVVTAGGMGANGKPSSGVWEPFLMMLPDGRLACYYSDSSEVENHSQKLSMRISEDGVTWGDTIEVKAMEDRTLRPGMSTVIQLNDGRFMMTYEMCDEDNSGCGNPVYYIFSDDGIDWGDPADPGTKVVLSNKAVPGSCPYLCYLPNYGEKGLILMTSGFQTPSVSRGNIVYVNDNLGDANSWKTWYQPINYKNPNGGYSRAIFAAQDGKTAYFVNNIPDENSEDGYYKMIFLRYLFEGKLDAK